MQIIPSVLTSSFTDFERQVHRMEILFPFIQIDVMDGKFVPNTSFSEIEKVNSIDTTLQFELHLMVDDPVAELRKWQPIDKVFRVLFPAEAKDSRRTISFIRKEGWEIGMVLNPETPLSMIEKFLPSLNVVQFMTVHPGRQGSPFLPEVEDKIRAFTLLKNRPLCAVDGAVNKQTIRGLAEIGVDIVYPGSALCGAKDVKAALKELQEAIAY